MRKTMLNRVLSVAKLAALVFLAVGELLAQSSTYPPYTIDYKAENAFAQAEVKATTYRPGFDNVPHLSPRGVANGLLNGAYMRPGSSHFTFVIAHRGSHSLPGCAENSACAIAQAYASGADAIELDAKVSNDGEAVLGHDVAIGRELNNWVNSAGQPVTRSQWNPFVGFPIMDATYQDLTKYPFFTNFKQVNQNGVTVVDPNNPTRSTMNVAQFQNGTTLDTYDEPTGNHQLTLFEALSIVANQFQMMVWIDIKSADDLSAVASAIQTARNDYGDLPALESIGLKITYATLANPKVNFNPGTAMGLNGIGYLMVFGTGDLDTMATYNGQSISSGSNPTQNIMNTIQNTCSFYSNGCLGVEIGHKDPNGPTLGVFNALESEVENQNVSLQIAGFHTVPQYTWFWQQYAGDLKTQQALFNRTFPRTDGSCCFALQDSLNASALYAGTETEDLRNLYSWNEQNFTLITTDEPALVLRDLYAQGKRPVQVAQSIGGTNTSTPSGGQQSDLGPYRDGLYQITNFGTTKRLAVDSNNNLTLASPLAGDRSQYWYVVSAGSGYGGSYDLINVQSGTALTHFGANPGLNIQQDSNLFPWFVTTDGFIQPVAAPNVNLGASNGAVILSSGSSASNSWLLTPIATPASELSQQQAGPSGYTYCTDEGGSCDLGSTFGSVAFGANGSFRFLPHVTGLQGCSASNFSNLDPAPNVHKACFVASYRPTAFLSNSYYNNFTGGVPEGNSLAPGMYAFGTGSRDDGAGLYTYKVLPNGGTCSATTFGYDPAVSSHKMCIGLTVSAPVGPSEFVPCSQEGQTCPFSGTAVVAFGDIRNSTPYLTYRQATNGVDCSYTSFGMDPDPGVHKACFYLAGTPDGYPGTPLNSSIWQTCGQVDSGSCIVPLGARMALGGSSAYQYSFVTASSANTTSPQGSPASATFKCSRSSFPVDPVGSGPEMCYFTTQLSTFRGPIGYSLCAELNGTCQFTGTANVAYGTDGHYIYKPGQTNSITCTRAAFGNGADPYQNVVKSCYYKLY